MAVVAGLCTQPSVFLWFASRLSDGAHMRASCLYQHALREGLTRRRANDLSSRDCQETPREEDPSSKKKDIYLVKDEKFGQEDREESSCQSRQRPTTSSARYGRCCCCCIYNAVEERKGRDGRGRLFLGESEGDRKSEGQREGKERVGGREDRRHDGGSSFGVLNKKIEDDRRNCLCGNRLQSRLYLLSDVLGVELLKVSADRCEVAPR